jgi:hypothetical protein
MSESTKSRVASKSFMVNGELQRSAHPEAQYLQFAFGPKDAPIATPHVALAEFSEDIRTALAWHGLSAKLGDSYADAKGNASAAFESFSDTLDLLKSGQWLAEGEKAGPRESDLAAAISQLRADKYPTVADAAAMLAGKSKEERAAIAGIQEIKVRVLEIRAERARKALEAAGNAAEGAASLDDI